MNPWESDRASFPRDLVGSWMEVIQRPGEFFRALNPTAPFSKPLIFFLIFSVLGGVASTLSWWAVFGDSYRDIEGYGLLNGRAYAWFNFFISPFLALIGLAINVGLTHVGVLLFFPTRKPSSMTARAYCYVVAPTVMALIPLVGWVISGIWVMVLTVIGIQHAHDTTTGRALAAVFVPPFALGLAFALFIFFLVFLAAAMGGQV